MFTRKSAQKRFQINLRHKLISKRPHHQWGPRVSRQTNATGFWRNALVATLALGTFASAALAAAMDPDVRARQEAMGLVGSNMKKIAAMAKGDVDFDAAAAQAAFAKIADKAAMVPALFEARSNFDPESEAQDAIWENWADFTAKASDLQAAAEAGAGVDSAQALAAAMGPLGGACKACHMTYKE